MMNEVSMTANPLLEIDTDFEAYLTAYTRSYKGHMVDGNLDYLKLSSVHRGVGGIEGDERRYGFTVVITIGRHGNRHLGRCEYPSVGHMGKTQEDIAQIDVGAQLQVHLYVVA